MLHRGPPVPSRPPFVWSLLWPHRQRGVKDAAPRGDCRTWPGPSVTSMSGWPRFAARRTLRLFSPAISRTSVALPGPCARAATMRPWAAGSSGPTYAKSPAAASCARTSPPARSTDVSGPNTAPSRCRSLHASGPLPAHRGAQPHPVVGQRQHQRGGTGGDRGRDDDDDGSAQLAEAGCVAAMPSNQLRTSFVPLASTRRSPIAGSIHRRTLNAYVFRVAGHLHVGPAGVRGPQDAPAALVALPRPCARTATMRPWAAGSSGSTDPKLPPAASGASASSQKRSTNVSGPNTAPGRCRSPQASSPLPPRRGAQPHAVGHDRAPAHLDRQHARDVVGQEKGAFVPRLRGPLPGSVQTWCQGAITQFEWTLGTLAS